MDSKFAKAAAATDAARILSANPADALEATSTPGSTADWSIAQLSAIYTEHRTQLVSQARRITRDEAEVQRAPIHDLRGIRLGWLGDLQGHLAIESGILDTCESGLDRLRSAGATVEALTLPVNWDDVWKAWLIWRSALVGAKVKAVMQIKGARELTKAEALWEMSQSEQHSLADLLWASTVRTQFYNAMKAALESVDALALPSAQVWAFDINQRWPEQINGRAMDTYHRWMEATIYATFAGLPAISVPTGFHAQDRTAMGMQLIGRPRGDLALLDLCAMYEKNTTNLLDIKPNL